MINFLSDEKRWNIIRTSDAYAHLRDMLIKGYEEICKDKDIPVIPFSTLFKYVKTGERMPFETPYLMRRKQLAIYAVMCMIYPEKEEYLVALEDLICAICEEYAWCVPAHLPQERINSANHLDLFSAETGIYLTEIKHMLITRLNPLVIERITENVERRIIAPFREKQFYFEQFKSNWASVCCGSIGMILMYEAPDVYMEVKPRIENAMKNYLESTGDDGSVGEGIDYWWYGFGYYLIYNDLLKRYTFGRIDRLKNEKVRKVAGFHSSIIMSKDVAYSFSDGDKSTKTDPFITSYISDYYGIGTPYNGSEWLCFSKFTYLVRDFLWYNPNVEASVQPAETYYDILGSYILRKDKYAFAIKAGHNREPHNHNDVGSFVVVSDNKQIFCDLGAPIYTSHTLSDAAYEDVVQKASFGHNVPIVNGKGQGLGKEYSGKLCVENEFVSIDFADAYINKPSKLTRQVKLLEDRIVLTDTFGNEDEYIERFVTEIQPEIGDGYIRIDCATASFDKNKFEASFVVHKTQYHSGAERTVYLIDVVGKGEPVFEMEITFSQDACRNGKK